MLYIWFLLLILQNHYRYIIQKNQKLFFPLNICLTKILLLWLFKINIDKNITMQGSAGFPLWIFDYVLRSWLRQCWWDGIIWSEMSIGGFYLILWCDYIIHYETLPCKKIVNYRNWFRKTNSVISTRVFAGQLTNKKKS